MRTDLSPVADSEDDTIPSRIIVLTVNGKRQRIRVLDRQLLVEVLREVLGLTGTHVGCMNGDCGACTVLLNGEVAKSCLLLAAAVDEAQITTIEGYADPNGGLTALQRALWEHDAFQCGFCIPGHLFALDDLLARNPMPSEEDVREALIGNICRCTGYVNLVAAVLSISRHI